jgi:hypothetical protein
MNIDGLKKTVENRGDNVITRFIPDGDGSYRHIRATRDAQNQYFVELVEGDELPGIDRREMVSIFNSNDHLLERMVRAMAVMHLRLYEVEDWHTDVDMAFIERGFHIALRDGEPHVWLSQLSDGSVIIISKTMEGGIPTHFSDKSYVVYQDAHGDVVKVKDVDIKDILKLIDSGSLQALVRQGGEVEIEGLHIDGYTLH